MSEQTSNQVDGSGGAQGAPQSAAEQRAALMADPQWRAGAMNGKGPQWAQLVELDRRIADESAAREDAAEHAAAAPAVKDPAAEAARVLSGEADDEQDAAAQAYFNAVPERASQYPFGEQLQRLQQAGLELDLSRDRAIREGLHAAQVPTELARMLYTAAVTATLRTDQSPAAQESERFATEHALRRSWGDAYERNVAATVGEARRIYDAMPDSIKAGRDYDDWILDSGIASNRVVVEQLFNRARSRRS